MFRSRFTGIKVIAILNQVEANLSIPYLSRNDGISGVTVFPPFINGAISRAVSSAAWTPQ
jgi:hypothetical protein